MMDGEREDRTAAVGFSGIALFLSICAFVFGILSLSMHINVTSAPAKTTPAWHGENYQGWDMPCNYTLGSNAEWNEKLQQYGDQKYLDCANGIVYVAVGDSPSTHYFNPKDDKTNAKYCPAGEVANFNYDNPLTAANEDGTFYDCSTW